MVICEKISCDENFEELENAWALCCKCQWHYSCNEAMLLSEKLLNAESEE